MRFNCMGYSNKVCVKSSSILITLRLTCVLHGGDAVISSTGCMMWSLSHLPCGSHNYHA